MLADGAPPDMTPPLAARRRLTSVGAWQPETAELLEILPIDGRRRGLRLVGEVDVSNRVILTAAMGPFVAGSGDVHLDLSELDFIDVGGVTALVEAAERLGAGRQLVLHRAAPTLRRVLAELWGPLHTVRVEPA